MYSFYVPLHSKESLHTKQKKINALELEGSGSTDVNEKKHENETDTKEVFSNPNSEMEEIKTQLETDPEKFNDMKRMRMGAPVHESFLHPKIIKTDKLIFSKPKSKQTDILKTESSKKMKHKFQLY